MAIRWRKNGVLICAAMSEAEPGDTYINDGLHYQLSVVTRAIVADPQHKENGLWHWVERKWDDVPTRYLFPEI